jgi:hypothetical protein
MHRLARHEHVFHPSRSAAAHIVWQVSTTSSGGLAAFHPYLSIAFDPHGVMMVSKSSISYLIYLLMPVGLKGAVRSTLDGIMMADNAINDAMR